MLLLICHAIIIIMVLLKVYYAIIIIIIISIYLLLKVNINTIYVIQWHTINYNITIIQDIYIVSRYNKYYLYDMIRK